MGLDIRLYTGVKLVKPKSEINHEDGVYGYMEDLERECVDVSKTVILQGNTDFPNHFIGEDGIYSYTQYEHVLSRSYSGYSNFRDALAKSVGYTPATKEELITCGMYDDYPLVYQAKVWATEGGTLYELINFSDCEGVIDTSTCKKIYGDLGLVDITMLHERDLEGYYSLLSACKRAAETNGVLVFG